MSQKVPFMSIMAIKALFMCCLSVALLTTVWLGTLLEDDHWTSSPLGGVEELESRSPLRRTQLSERASFIKARGESIVTSKGAEDLFDMDSGKPYSELDPLYSNEHKRNTDRRSTDCRRPRRLHLSPASSVVSKEFSDTTVFVIDMYISFTVDKYGCPESEKAAPVVFYGKVVDDDEHKHRIDTSSLERLQFDFYSTLLTIESSSWIFHGIMKDLAVDTEFWYEIVVHDSPHGVGVESGGDRTIALMQDQGIIQTSSLRETRSLPTISSGKRTFFTPSALGNPTSLAFVGDWGTTKNSLAVMQKLSEAIKPNTAFEHLNVDGAKVSTDAISPRNLRVHDYRTKGLQPQSESQQPPISAVIVVGDLSYANGHLSGWETWLEAMHPLFAHIPILVAAGNHELECDQRKFLLFQAYENYFRTPYHHQRQPAHFEPVPLGPKRLECTHPSDFVGAVYQGGNSYYSFRQGLVHLIVLNSYIDTTKGSMQYQWLESELKTRINRAFTPWLIVVFHAPLHTTFHGHNNDLNPKLMMQYMEPLFRQYGVNLVFAGHNHAYVRTHSLKYSNATIDLSGKSPVYVTIGTGGDSHSPGPISPTPEPWVASRDRLNFGAGELQLVNATHAYWERLLVVEEMLKDGYSDDESSNPSLDPVWFFNYHAPK